MKNSEEGEFAFEAGSPLFLSGELDDVEVKLEDVCTFCRQGFHNDCDEFWVTVSERSNDFEWVSCCCGGGFDSYTYLKEKELSSFKGGGWNYVGGPKEDEPIDTYIDNYSGSKSPEDYTDPLSSGRKMAAKVAPIAAGLVCEWAWLAKAGGGIVPIMGCPGRPASDRHHGPDKNTLNNNLGTNLHRICDWCHNQWHAKNDPGYGPRPTKDDGSVDASVPFAPDGDYVEHDPVTRAKDEDVYKEDALRREEARRHGADI
jgi:hypothetical protein